MLTNVNNHDSLCELLGYKFQNKTLLQQALTRKSGLLEGLQEKSVGHNERLEFFGDSILRTVVDDILMEKYPNFGEDKLSQERDRWVSKNGFLYISAKNIDLGKFIIMGKGERNNYESYGAKKILTDTLEAIIGAIFIDCGKSYEVIKRFLIKHAELVYDINCATINNYNEAVEKVLSADLNLFIAVIKGDLAKVTYWLSENTDPNYVHEKISYPISCPCCIMGKSVGWTEIGVYARKSSALDLAVRKLKGFNQNTLAIVKLLLEKGAKPNNLNGFSYPVLHETIIYYPNQAINCEKIFIELCELLCRYADVNLRANAICCINGEKPKSGFTPLELAIMRDNYEQVTLLLKYGANPNDINPENGKSSLHIAARLGNISIVKLLLQNNARKEIADNKGNLPWSEVTESSIINLLKPAIKYNETKYTSEKSPFFEGTSKRISSAESEFKSSPYGRKTM